MHAYATDSEERERVILALAVLAVGAAWIVSRVLAATRLVIPWWADAPSTMGFFFIFFALFDRALWRASLLHRLGLVKVPVLAGNWRGYVSSSFDKYTAKHDVRVQIVQTWTRIAVLLQSSSSRSYTLVAAIDVHASDGVVLSYQYQNEPQPGAVKTMHIHHGTGRLIYSDSRILSGDYYSGRGRQNYGSIYLEKMPGRN